MTCENCDSLAAQVVVLRKAAEGVRVEHVAPMVTRLRGTKRMQEVLADTEAAATTWLESHDREQQLAGARELVRRVPAHTDPYAPEWVSASGMRAVLEAMEHEDATESKPPPPDPPDRPMHTQL